MSFTVESTSNAFVQEWSVGNHSETKQTHTSHLRSFVNLASLHGLGLNRCTNQEQISADGCDKIHIGGACKMENFMQKLLIPPEGMPLF